jgi:hypothetical protein
LSMNLSVLTLPLVSIVFTTLMFFVFYCILLLLLSPYVRGEVKAIVIPYLPRFLKSLS